MQDYKNIIVWQKSYHLVLQIYKLTETFPKHELYALTTQLRRAAVSIPSNIAEGSAKESDLDFARFLEMAIGSAFEIECQLMLAGDLGYIQQKDVRSILQEIAEVKKMLAAFIKKLRSKKL